MRIAKLYPAITKHIYHSEIMHCPTCGTRLRRYDTLAQRTIVTLYGVLFVDHRGHRCPDPDCVTADRSSRSAVADSLALPNFTFGLGVVLHVGYLRPAHYQTVAQVHAAIHKHLTPYAVTISRREILYLVDASCTLLRASQSIADDHAWQTIARTNRGIILFIDGIQPDKGDETIYLVRNMVTGRLLAAANVRSSDAATITALLCPTHDLEIPVIGAVSDVRESLLQGMVVLWPNIPHQVYQFHYLREASHPMYDLDRSVCKQMRTAIQQDVRTVRQHLEHHTAKHDPHTDADQRTVAQLQILDDYALALQTALNVDAFHPLAYASPAVDAALAELTAGLERLEKGAPEPGRYGETRPTADHHGAAGTVARRPDSGAAVARRCGGSRSDPVRRKAGGAARAGDERGGADAV